MTKETKIGLLVGLAFIILFAIILSEKGATNTATSPSELTLVEGTPLGQAAPNAEPFDDIGQLNVHSQQPARPDADRPSDSLRVMREEPAGRDIPVSDEDVLPLPAAVVDRLNLHTLETEIDVDDVASTPAQPMTLSEALSAALTNSTTRDATPPADDGAGRAEDRAAMARASGLESPGGTPLPATDESQPKPPDPRMKSMKIKRLATHTVQPGESLSKIAARYYGRATPARITAIFDANRKTLPSIDRVRAGNQLDIPELDDMQTIAFEPVRDFPAADVVASRGRQRESGVRIPIPVDPPASSASPRTGGARSEATRNPSPERANPRPAGTTDFRWYEVCEKDTLSGIAKRELGNERRFLDIARLNRDIISDKDTIRPGLKIRLPLKTAVANLSANALTALGPDAATP